jgi:UDP-N-acetyl-alpha-D-quinovosamine dehydrogenase
VSVVVVTGADGFVGRRLCLLLERCGHEVRRVVRKQTHSEGPPTIATGDFAHFTDWSEILRGVDAVVHLAARAHVLAKESRSAGDGLYQAVNVHATAQLAQAAAKQNVRRFLFVSSIGVNGNETAGRAFTEADAPSPVEPYAVSKWEAEQTLARIHSATRADLVVIRPSLVYGPGVKGNLLRLLRLVALGIPLPFGDLRCPRSFIGVDNLCDLLLSCIVHPRAGGELFLAAEPEFRSVAEFVEAVASGMGYRNQVWRCPPRVLRLVATLLGKGAELTKLQGPLQVDPSKAMTLLNWRPRTTFSDGVAAMVADFARARK